MNETWREQLVTLAKETRIGSAELEPLDASGTLWRVLTGPADLRGTTLSMSLSTSYTPVVLGGRERALGLALNSRLQPRGMVVWPMAPDVSPAELAAALGGCRDLYWQVCEEIWMDSLSTVVNALREQRRELGSALHRGPAQALTAARLELSMLGEKVELGPLQEALEDASEGLVGLVHGKLHGRTKGESLDAALRAEIHFQARWHDLPSEGDAITLPHSPLNTTLTRLWRLAGGHIEEDNTQTTFLLTEISR